MNTRRIQLFAFVVFVAMIAAFIAPKLAVRAANQSPFKKLLTTNASLAPNAMQTHKLGIAGKLCSLSVSIPTPSAMGDAGTIHVTLKDGDKVIASKPLHVGDPDLYLTFRATNATLELISKHDKAIAPNIQVLQWPDNKMPNVEAEPNDTWQDANEFQLGKTMFATADDIPYIAPLNADTTNYKRGYEQTPEYDDRLPNGGADWFKFNFTDDAPKLVHFEIDLLERDNIPVNVEVFTIENNQAKPYEKGADPVTPPHEVQALPGNKFTTRVLTKGTYYVKVEARHPAYQLRTYVYDLPPYNDPHKAVRAGMDFIVSAGDSWHANTPRHGGIVNRVSNNHNETLGCVACHATHFPLRAELTAKANGYTIQKRAAVQFLTERFYNTTRPFYGHPEASWTRVISASANVLSRMAALLNIYETEVTGERHTDYLKGVVNYLKLYYKGRTYLPNDESNGNTPLVSAYEVAMYSWKAFDEYAKQAGDKESLQYRDQVRKLIEQDRHKNLIDLCYQTQAMTMIDASGYADKIKRNAERLLSLQRADGQWSMLFEPDSASVEFQTGHSLYTLALAGYAANHPQIKRGVDYLLARQQEWGGWFDPRQSYENFRTPFRETQFAVMALSQLYKEIPVSSKEIVKWDNDQPITLEEMSKLDWKSSPTLTKYLLEKLSSSDDALEKQYAAAALGRSAVAEATAPLMEALDDDNKMVQLAAAWALRQIATRRENADYWLSYLLRYRQGLKGDTGATVEPKNYERIRWAASRIYAQHFANLTNNSNASRTGNALLGNLRDESPVVRLQASKSLSQWFYWTRDEAVRWKIVDWTISALSAETHPWVRRNLIEALYSMADENVRYLYNNWIALLATPEDREQAKRGHREHSLQMAKRISVALETGNALQREGLLQAITEFHLRAGGYAGGGRYTRIGNDVENVQFYDDGAKLMEKALLPLLASDNLKLRKQAIIAANTVRDQALDSLPLLVLQQLNDGNAGIRI
ncbi:MAG TPA: HEAT repeat domain-containing protein, partial [Blastocatellia bacterium]|nr:HEAT repeat domain-containing protein [Blastocatellia bacterium]